MSGASPEAASLARQVAKGAFLMVALRFAFRLIGLVSTLILVRVLTPADFGIVGLVTAAQAVLELLSELSFQLALIRMPAPQREHYDTTWTLGCLRGAVLAAGLLIAAPFLADMVDDHRVVLLSVAVAGVALLGALENVGVVDFQRELRFDRVFRYQLVGKLAGFIVAIPLALTLRSYWALMAGIAAARAAQVVMSYVMHPYRPRPSLARWRELFDFSKWLMVANIQWVIDSYSMTFIVGRIAGTAAIGLYQVAYQIAALPASEIAAPIRPPMYAGFARVADDRAALRQQVLDGLALMMTIIVPLSIGIALMASSITRLGLGQSWSETIPLIRLCAFYALFDAIGHFTHNVYTVLHRQRRFVGVFTVALAVRLPSVVMAAIWYGVTGAAAAMAVTAAFNMILWTSCLFPLLGIGFPDILRGVWRCLLATAVMAASVWGLLVLWPEAAGTLPVLMRATMISLCGGIVHIAAQLVAWHMAGSPPGAEAQFLGTVRATLGRFTAPSSRRAQTAG
jgi:O-antigen/teichoic acid export membrane protein